MTLPSSGPLSLGNLKNEFGGNVSPKLSDYYRGGSFNSSWSEKVVTQGAISLKQFQGLSKPYSAKSNFVAIRHNYSSRDTVGWYVPTLIIEDGSIAAGSVPLTKLANYLTGSPNVFQFQLRKVGNVLLPANYNFDYYNATQGNKTFMEIKFDRSGDIMVKPNPEYLGTGYFSQMVDFLYVDSYGRVVVKAIKLQQKRT